MSLTPTRMPDYPRSGGSTFKPIRDRQISEPRIGKIMGISSQELHDAISLVLANGCALLFSPTSDGGALSVTVYVGETRHRDYVASAEEFAELLMGCRDLAEAHTIKHPLSMAKVPQRSSQKA